MDGNPDELVLRARFGMQVEQFLTSDIGRYLQNRALDEMESGVEDFKKCNPSDVDRMRVIQNKVNQAEKFKSWLEEAVYDGVRALKILEEEQE